MKCKACKKEFVGRGKEYCSRKCSNTRLIKWTSEMDQFLLENKEIKIKELSSSLGKTRSAIENRRKRLGIGKSCFKDIRYEPFRDETTKAYLAGIIDGEGTVGLYQQKNRILARLSIYTTTKELVDYLTPYGWRYTTSQRRFDWKLSYHLWEVKSSDILYILDNILPYMIIKRRNAEVVIEFLKLRLQDPANSDYTDKEKKIYTDWVKEKLSCCC